MSSHTHCATCLQRLTDYELRTAIGKEGHCAECATTNMIMGGMTERTATLYYEGTHEDAVRDEVLRA